MGLDPLNAAIGTTQGYGTQGYDPAQAAQGVNTLKGYMTPENSWYAQNFGLGGSMPSFIDNIYKKFYDRDADEAGKEFWTNKVNDYKTAGTPETDDDKSDAEARAWVLTHFLGRSDEFQNKLSAENQGKPADYKDPSDWAGYRNNARMQSQALNRLPFVADPGKFSPTDKAANTAQMYPAHLQQGAVDRVVAGGANLGPQIADAQEAAGQPRDTSGAAAALSNGGLTEMLNYIGTLGLGDDINKKIMDSIKSKGDYEKGLYYGGKGKNGASDTSGADAAAMSREDRELMYNEREWGT